MRPYRASRWCTGLAEAWLYNYTDFGEGRGRSPQPVLRAVVEVATPLAHATFQAVIDTGGPITVIAGSLLGAGGDPVATGSTMVLRLGGATNEVPIYELTLESALRLELQRVGRLRGGAPWQYWTRGRCRAQRSCSGRQASSTHSQ